MIRALVPGRRRFAAWILPRRRRRRRQFRPLSSCEIPGVYWKASSFLHLQHSVPLRSHSAASVSFWARSLKGLRVSRKVAKAQRSETRSSDQVLPAGNFDLLVLNCGNQNCTGARGLLNFDFAPFAAIVVTCCCRTTWNFDRNLKTRAEGSKFIRFASSLRKTPRFFQSGAQIACGKTRRI